MLDALVFYSFFLLGSLFGRDLKKEKENKQKKKTSTKTIFSVFSLMFFSMLATFKYLKDNCNSRK